MRARGANVTDIVILVVAADDGVMPQTMEAINHAKAAGVPMIVAINKIDKPDAKPQKVREELLQHEVIVEDMGGDVQDVEVSATKKTNLDKLLEAIELQAEILELKANPDRAAEGTVIEAKLDKGRGPLATVLVQRGTLRVGDVFVAGASSGKVRAMIDDHGRQVKEAGPSIPVEVLGLSVVPSAGDPFTVVENEARAREVAAYRQGVLDRKRTTSAPVSLENMFANHASTTMEFPLVVKADVQGSVEAIVHALNRLSTDEIKVRVLHSGVGAITESDVTLASASGAPIIGFNVRPNAKAREVATRDQGRASLLRRHLSPDRLGEGRDGRRARARDHRDGGRPRPGPGSFPGGQEGQGCRPARPRRRHPQGPQRPPHPRGRHRLEDHDQLAAAVQGRRGGSTRRPRMRRAAGRHQRHQAGRQPRSVRGRGARADAVTMRRVETPEGRSVRLLRVGEQVRHVLSELLQRGEVHDADAGEPPRQHHRSAHVARPSPRDGVREAAARPGRGRGAEGAAHRTPPTSSAKSPAACALNMRRS